MNIMKTVKTIISLAIAATSALGFTACDEVDEADRYKELTKIESKRNVLIEDFTGQMCTNCPDGHRTIVSLKEQYGSQVIAVGIHAGIFGIAEGKNPAIVGLMQPEGDEYAKNAGVETYPSAVIDRRSGALALSEWASYVRTAFERDCDLNIKLTAKINGGKIDIHSQFEQSANISGKYQIWVTESNIVALQIDNGKTITDYVHNHVYRTSVNGTQGENISLSANVFSDLNHSVDIKDNWNRENLSVVAFVYNEDGVVQAQECEVEQ